MHPKTTYMFLLFSDLVKNCDLMMKQSVWTTVIAASIAANHLKKNGMLALTGAQPALTGTPGMCVQYKHTYTRVITNNIRCNNK